MALQVTIKRKASPASLAESADYQPAKKVAYSAEPMAPPTPKQKCAKKTVKKTARKRLTVKSTKYIHVHQYLDTKRWGAWYNCPMGTGERLYFGTHLTENLAARAQDRALLKYRPLATRPIQIIFNEADYAPDHKLRAMLTNQEFTDLLAAEAHPCYKRVEPTECLVKFMAEEAALGNLPTHSGNNARYRVEPLGDYLKRVIQKRTSKVTASLTLKAENLIKAEPAEMCLSSSVKDEANPNAPVLRSSRQSPVSSSSIIPAAPIQPDVDLAVPTALAIVPVQPEVLALASVPEPIASSAPADCTDALPKWIGARSRRFSPRKVNCPPPLLESAKNEAKINEGERVNHELQRNLVRQRLQERLKGKMAMIDEPKIGKKMPVPKPVSPHRLELMVEKINLKSEVREAQASTTRESGQGAGTFNVRYADAPGVHSLADVALSHEVLQPYKL